MKFVELHEEDFKDNLVPPSCATQSIYIIQGFKTELRLAKKLGRSVSALVGEISKSMQVSHRPDPHRTKALGPITSIVRLGGAGRGRLQIDRFRQRFKCCFVVAPPVVGAGRPLEACGAVSSLVITPHTLSLSARRMKTQGGRHSRNQFSLRSSGRVCIYT
jgi:hypothetical protein